MRNPTALLLAIAVAIVVGACSSSSGASAAPRASATPAASASPGASRPPAQGGGGAAGLDGRTFLSTDVSGRALVAGSRVRLAFQGGRLSANAGCNTMGGSYAVAGGMLVARELATTEMGCSPQLMEQDRWLAELLGGAGLTVDGNTMTLERAGVRLTLLDRKVADPDHPLVGTRWVVDGIVSGDAVSSVPAGVTAAITIADGRVTVEAGCNGGGGPVEVTDGVVVFGRIAYELKLCAPEVMAVERAVSATLTGRVAYTIEAGTLTLDARGSGLVLRASP